MKFSRKEIKAMDDFMNKHLDCYRKEGAKSDHTGFTINVDWVGGIGIGTDIKCNCCGESMDVTDYDTW